jgi:hypothetical protein
MAGKPRRAWGWRDGVSLIPLVAGLVAVLYIEVGERFGERLHIRAFEPRHETALILILVALIALTVGLERYTHFQEISDRFDNLHHSINQSLTTRFISDQEEIYDEPIRLIPTAEHSIKILIYGKRPPAPERFAHALCSHLATHRNIMMDVVITADLSVVGADFWERHAERYKIFADQGVGSQVRRFIWNNKNPAGFDLIIIDEKHADVGFSPVPGREERNKEFAIQFESQPSVVAQLKAWYDNVLIVSQLTSPFDNAFSEWSRRRARKQKEGDVT